MNPIKSIINKFSGTIPSLAFILMLSTGMMLSGCRDKAVDEPKNPDQPEQPDYTEKTYYLSLDVKLPGEEGTRSSTDSDGSSNENPDTEDGKENENKLINAIFYFYIVDEEANNIKTERFAAMFNASQYESSGAFYKVRAEVKPDDLRQLAGSKIRLYIGANYLTHNFENWKSESAWFSMGNTVDDLPLGLFGTDNKGKLMPMANKDMYEVNLTTLDKNATDVELFAAIAEMMKDATTGEPGDGKTLDLSKQNGPLQLERCVARIDIKPNHGKDTDNRDLGNNLYQVGKIANLFARMDELQVINVKKSSYLFRHTAPGDKDGAEFSEEYNKYIETIFDWERHNDYYGERPETDTDETHEYSYSYRWISDNDWFRKKGWALSATNAGYPGNDYFFNQPTKSADDVTYYVHPTADNKYFGKIKIDDVDDNVTPKDGFYPWCYISENTLPSTSAMLKGLSTGIAFKMLLCDMTCSKYLTEEDFITQEEYNALKEEYQDALDEGRSDAVDGTVGKVIGQIEPIENESKFVKLTVGNQECYAEKVTVGEGVDSQQAYAVTYYYFIRHNVSADHVLGVMEPMEYAVVRNNIYKLSVTALNALPDPYDPEDPDEPKENNLAVEFRVLSWAKVNNDEVSLGK